MVVLGIPLVVVGNQSEPINQGGMLSPRPTSKTVIGSRHIISDWQSFSRGRATIRVNQVAVKSNRGWF